MPLHAHSFPATAKPGFQRIDGFGAMQCFAKVDACAAGKMPCFLSFKDCGVF
jgi:hypothetical protein